MKVTLCKTVEPTTASLKRYMELVHKALHHEDPGVGATVTPSGWKVEVWRSRSKMFPLEKERDTEATPAAV